ncbi:S-formylglutathione hydrolase [Lentisphaera profundi]|uniref:S-formylglutathione hydrolase n=1 Tax=Lentisphaera profundi TaxID=1658616 RepID=UPI003B67CE61
MEKKSENLIFNGQQLFYSHQSSALNCEMTFSIFIPPQAKEKKCPVLYWLSGLTCTADNFTSKSGFQRYAAEHGIIVVAPDTSPRGESVKDIKDAWDIGCGAGFYLNATSEGWKDHYQMYDYVVKELPGIIKTNFPCNDKASVSGHSMGGHGALICALKNPQQYQSVSAFAPIVHPLDCPWGTKAFTTYLGDDQTQWSEWDAVELIKQGNKVDHILVEQGLADNFLEDQLKTDSLKTVCAENKLNLILNDREGYDHSYYFISSFIGEHIKWHAQFLN